ncbi:MAG: hypothetical protein CEN87_22 [Parcubacteria group bacterium Licking1014_1]|nr:MAG: hypothetical protein CEN87_22 [Parcubacteria group bacterium Licking1014_1]
MAEEKQPKKEKEEEKKEEDGSKAADKGSGGNIASPEGILMLCIAGIIDIISIIPVVNFISGMLGTIVIGGWLVIMRPGYASKQAIKRIAFRFFVVFFMEYVPVISAAPSWTWFVYKTLKDS